MAEPFIGQVDLFGFNFVPEHWGQCDGSMIPIDDNQALYALLGTAYGGDGRSTFALPDLRGKVAVGWGQYPGSRFDWDMGDQRGSETQTLTTQQLPKHSHSASFSYTLASVSVILQATTEEGDSATPSAGAYLAQTKAPQGGRDKPEFIYKSSPASGTTVPLGGVEVAGAVVPTGRSVTLFNTGGSQPFSILQAGLVVNYCIALQGLFPSRS
ncbi:tail fiber protein [Photobacterium sp. MCCC 1A19761]|uniref:phage tail protein n=1 Tax=Photobacterium sp. MCCC 1A19761 TaxID=3115000 RepID=UPI00307D974D